MHRIVLVATWILVSMLAVVGFAGFSASDDSPASESSPTTYRSDLGSDAGAAAAMAFAFMSGDEVLVQAKSLPPETTTPPDPSQEESETQVSSATTFERSSILDEATVRDIVAAVFAPEDVSRAIRSAWCASNFNPRYQNSETGAAGLFQLTPEQWTAYAADAGQANSEIGDPEASAAVAAHIVYRVGGGWSNLACSG